MRKGVTRVVLLALFIFAVPSFAASRYVDVTPPGGCVNGTTTYDPTAGAGAGACGSGSNTIYTTIANASVAAVAGDTVFLREGTYAQGLNCQTQTCNSGTDWTTGAITWKPYNSEVVTINGSVSYYASGDGYAIWDGTNTMTFDLNKAASSSCFNLSTQTGQPVPHHIRVRDLVCRETDNDGITIFKSSTMEVIHVTFVDNGDPADTLGMHGIYAADVIWDGTSQAGLLVENSSFSDSACMGVQVYDSVRNSTNVIIRNNIFTAMPVNTNYGSGAVFLGGTGGYGPSGALVYNNLIYSPIASTSPIWPIAISTGDQCKIFNNSIYMGGSSGHHGISVNLPGYYSAIGNQIVNNLIFNTGGQRYTNNGTGTICSTNNFNCSGGAQLFDPLFVSTTDLQLQAGSPALGAGTAQTADFTTDYAGVTRTVPWDIGAYEKVSGASISVLSPSNPGLSYVKNTSVTVTWSSTGTPGNVSIKYGTDGATYPTTLSASTTDDGTQAVTMPNAATTTARVQICDVATGLVCGTSANEFALTNAAGGTFTKIISDNTTGTYIGDISGTSDNQPFNYNTTANRGTVATFDVHKYSDISNTIIKFDGLSQIPSDATVTDVTLGIYLESSEGAATAQTIDVYRLLRDWGETTSNWDTYDGTNSWTTGGALGSGTDIDADLSEDFSGVTNTPGWFTAQDNNGTLLDDVQKMVNGTYSDYGWLYTLNGAGPTSIKRTFTSSEGTNGQRPYLAVTYTVTVGSITVTAPTNGGHVFPGQTIPIRWQTDAISGNVAITLSRDGGATFDETISSGVAYNAPDFSWTVPTGRVHSSCIVKVCSGATCGTSAPFRIGSLISGVNP